MSCEERLEVLARKNGWLIAIAWDLIHVLTGHNGEVNPVWLGKIEKRLKEMEEE